MERFNKINRTALIDGDVLVYTAACGEFSRSNDCQDLCDRVIAEVADWGRRAFCNQIVVAFSAPRDTNFRRDFWPKYKANRDDKEAPPFLKDGIAAVTNAYKTITRPRIEADDILGILGSYGKELPDGSTPVIVTRDKDLRQVPGWHFNPEKEDFPVWIDPLTADRFFYQQWMTGDTTDNVPGMFKWGPAKAAKLLDGTPRADWTKAVFDAYAAHPKNYEAGYALAMARAVRVLRAGEWDKTKEAPILWNPETAVLPGLTPA
jgi:DNA polymerase-1